jgi:hypothetical protein
MPEADIITNRHAADAADLEGGQQESAAHSAGPPDVVSFKDLVPAMAAADSSMRTSSSVGHLTHRQSSLFASGVPTIDDVMSKCQQLKLQPAPFHSC